MNLWLKTLINAENWVRASPKISLSSSMIAHICNGLVSQASLESAPLARANAWQPKAALEHVPKKLIDFCEFGVR